MLSPARMSPWPWLAALGLAAGMAPAQDLQDLAAIRRAGEAFVEAQTRTLPGRVEIAVASPDPRTRLARCEQLEAFLAPGVKLWGNANVGIRCAKPEGLTVYLPVTIKVFADVVVLARLVPRSAESDYLFLVLEIDPSTFDLRRLIVRERTGNTSEFLFRGLVTNPKTDPNLFRFTIPKGVAVVRQDN